MTLFKTLANYLMGSVDAKAKFIVSEITSVSIANSDMILQNDQLKLIKDRTIYKVIYAPTQQPKKAFVLFYHNDLDEAMDSFTMLDKKIHSILECSKDLNNVASLQKISDAVFLHPTYNSLQVSIVAGAMDCINNKEFATPILANEQEASKGKTALMVAIETENKELIQAVTCIEGMNLNLFDLEGNSCFHYASASCDPSIIKILASMNASPLNHLNNEGESALHVACRYNKPDNVEMLMRWKVDPFLSKAKNYPLHTALLHNSIESLKVLLSWKPSIMKLKGSAGKSPLHLASNKEMVEFLLQQGCQMEERNEEGLTPLLSFILLNNYQVSILLLTRGANVQARDHMDNGALHFAVLSDNVDMVKLVIVFGSDLNLCNSDSFSPRHLAVTTKLENRDRILYHLNEAGATRCSHDKIGCSDGCVWSGTFNGSKVEKDLSSSNSNYNMPPYVVEEYKTFKCCFDAALERMLKGYVEDKKTKKKTSRSGDRVLCLDGGGIRGLISIQILMALEGISGKPMHELFDWIAGTSTGGIIAVGLLQRKTLKFLLNAYFALKNTVFKGKRPYDSDVLEKLIKESYGEYTKMSDITSPKLMLFSTLVDRIPAKLQIFRNYSHPVGSHDSVPSPFKQFPPVPKPEEQYVWQAVRATGAAPTFFRSFGRYLDGGLMSNNPTLDCLTEITNYNESLITHDPNINPPPIHVVVSIGTGQTPIRFMEECDIYRPGAIWDVSKVITGAKNLGEIMFYQATNSDGTAVFRSSGWCNSIKAPYFRFNPPLENFVPLDAMDDEVLVNMMWEVQCYLQTCHEQLVQLVQLLH